MAAARAPPLLSGPAMRGLFLRGALPPHGGFSRNSIRAAETPGHGDRGFRGSSRGRYDADGVMRIHRNRLLLTLCAILAATGAQAREISVQEAVLRAQHEVDGKVLSVQALNVGKRKVYRIKILTRDGRVRIVQVQAEQ
ncbi:hypothetical protein [Dokdonella sp.]|uniref:PepSY domain-containing protein n=1 Tax=Dokdonella sp. TaxID=2291710 RepID=UPI002F3FE74E